VATPLGLSTVLAWPVPAASVSAPEDVVSALEDLYLRVAPALLGYFRARGAADPEDLVGDVFVGVARGLGRFRGDDDALRRWVFTIAYRRLADDHRRKASRPTVPVPTPPSVAVHDLPTGFDVDLVRASPGSPTPSGRSCSSGSSPIYR
jgi:DNA-directed RNA polymerase specialized sigma24 family protein